MAAEGEKEIALGDSACSVRRCRWVTPSFRL